MENENINQNENIDDDSIELGNLMFGNSRGPIRFERKNVELVEWQKLLETIGLDECYCYFNTPESVLKQTSTGGYACKDDENKIIFEISPYYWGECTCGAEEENDTMRQQLERDVFTKKEIETLYTFPPFCEDDCPASDIDDEEEIIKNKESILSICTCGNKKKAIKYYEDMDKMGHKLEIFNKRLKENHINHGTDCLLIKHNFIYHPEQEDEFWIDWYKYPFRDSFCNRKITMEEFKDILRDCTKQTIKDLERHL